MRVAQPKGKLAQNTTRKFVKNRLGKEGIKLWVAGGICCEKPVVGGFETFAQGFPKVKRDAYELEAIRQLRTRPSEWTYIFITFMKDNEEMEFEVLNVKGKTLEDIDSSLSPLLKEFFESSPEHKRLGYGWIAVPSKLYTFTNKEQLKWLKRFREWRAFDKEHTNAMVTKKYQSRVERILSE